MFNPKNKSRGQVLVIFAVGLLAFIGFAALAIDVAYWYHTRHQLQGAADAASLAGAAKLTKVETDKTQTDARAEAVLFAAKNVASKNQVIIASDGTNTLSAGNDITVGHWSGTSYTPDAEPVNAVQVRPRRTTDSPPVGGGAITTFFGRIFGIDTVNISVQAIALRRIGTVAPLAVNEYWCGDNPSSCSDEGFAPYPHSFFRFNNISTVGLPGPNKGPSANWCPPPNGSSTNPWCATHPNQGVPLAIAGANAISNNQPSSYKGFPALDYRVNSYLRVAGVERWYKMPNTTSQINDNQVDTSIGDWAPYLNFYPHDPPVTVTERFLANYDTNNPINPYPVPPPAGNVTSSAPFATLAYNTGVAVGQTVSEMIGNGNYRNGRYEPGKDIVVLVYDGLVQGSAQLTRVTVVGYAKMRIIGYGNSLSDAQADPFDRTGNSAYAYALEPLRACEELDVCKQILKEWAPTNVLLVQ